MNYLWKCTQITIRTAVFCGSRTLHDQKTENENKRVTINNIPENGIIFGNGNENKRVNNVPENGIIFIWKWKQKWNIIRSYPTHPRYLTPV